MQINHALKNIMFCLMSFIILCASVFPSSLCNREALILCIYYVFMMGNFYHQLVDEGGPPLSLKCRSHLCWV